MRLNVWRELDYPEVDARTGVEYYPRPGALHGEVTFRIPDKLVRPFVLGVLFVQAARRRLTGARHA